METALVLQFAALAAMLVMTPGADWSYAIAAGLRARRVAPSVTGLLAGYVVVVAVVALGVGSLVASHPAALTALTVCGSAYLLWLGATTLLGPAASLDAAGVEPVDNPRGQFLRGAGVSGFNPKALLLLLAVLPQFVTRGGWAVPVQMGLLGAWFILCCAVVYFGVAHLSRRLLRSRPAAGAVVTRFAGCAMILVALVLLGEKALQLLA